MNQRREMTAMVVASSSGMPVRTMNPIMMPSLTPIPPGVIRAKTPSEMLKGQEKITAIEN